MQHGTRTPSNKQDPSGDVLEARVCQLWFWEGFFTRRSIDLKRFYRPDPLQVTDLDLLAFEFGPTLKRRKYIGEAKSGRGRNAPAPLDRIIWLRGLIALTDADGGELTTATIPSPRVRDLATSLGITAQSLDDLARREQLARINEVEDLGSQGVTFLSDLAKIRRECSRDPELERAFAYLRSEAWLIDPWLATKRTITIVRRISKRWIPGLREEEFFALRWLMCEAVCIVAVNLITIAKYAIELSKNEYIIYVGNQLAEGLAPAQYMDKVSDAVDTFLGRILTQAQVPQSAIIKSMGAFLPTPPEYLEPLLETTQRLAAGASYARLVPRFLDVTLFERVLYQRNVSPLAIRRLGLPDENLVSRAARLIVVFLHGQADLPSEFLDALSEPPLTNNADAKKDEATQDSLNIAVDIKSTQ